MRLVEVENVTPILRCGLLGGFLGEVLAHGRKLSRPIRPQGKQIEAIVLNSYPKADGFNSSLLSDYVF